MKQRLRCVSLSTNRLSSPLVLCKFSRSFQCNVLGITFTIHTQWCGWFGSSFILFHIIIFYTVLSSVCERVFASCCKTRPIRNPQIRILMHVDVANFQPNVCVSCACDDCQPFSNESQISKMQNDLLCQQINNGKRECNLIDDMEYCVTNVYKCVLLPCN